MRVLFRADADGEIGSGHVMRCTALATRLRKVGIDSVLVAARLPAPIQKWMRRENLEFRLLNGNSSPHPETDVQEVTQLILDCADVGVVVVDHYGLDSRWEEKIRPLVGALWVIDDLANRPHSCDVLLDPGLHLEPDRRYRDWVPTNCRQLLGPTYALLRPEFDFRPDDKLADGSLANLLIYLGSGRDMGPKIVTVLQAVSELENRPKTRVLLGPLPDSDAVRKHIEMSYPHVQVIGTSSAMASLLRRANLCVGVCGVSAWERCSLGIPTLTAITAPNQIDDARLLEEFGATKHVGDANRLTSNDWLESFVWASDNPQYLRDMSEKGRALVPGWTEAEETVLELMTNV